MKIDKEFDGLMPDLKPEELQLLRDSIKREGCRSPLVIWDEEDILVDGHNRFRICKDEDIQYNMVRISLPGRLQAKLWILNNQEGQRNLSPLDKIAQERLKQDILKELARERQKTRGPGIYGGKQLPQNSAEPPDKPRSENETRNIMAQEAGVSHDTLTKGFKILDYGCEELKDAVRKKEISFRRGSKIAELPEEEQRRELEIVKKRKGVEQHGEEIGDGLRVSKKRQRNRDWHDLMLKFFSQTTIGLELYQEEEDWHGKFTETRMTDIMEMAERTRSNIVSFISLFKKFGGAK